MKSIVILTATYNHPQELQRLYQSLKEQTDKDFTWLVIDDGSREETVEAIRFFSAENAVDIYSVRQENGGKCRAINSGLNYLAPQVAFVVIVDDDEKLRSNAVEVIRQYYANFRNSTCGVIHFNRMNEKGKIIARPVIEEDNVMSYQQFKSEGRFADGYIGYYTDKLEKTRFPEYDGEKYVGPSVLFMRVTEHCDLLWASAVLGDTEYLAGGITKQGRKLRIKNPRGMIDYCTLMQRNGASLNTRLVYSVHGYAYYALLDKSGRKSACTEGLLPLRFCGILLAAYWKRKYRV